VFAEQILNLPAQSRLLLQDRSHVPTLLLETEMIGKMRPHSPKTAAQFPRTFARGGSDSFLQFLEVAEESSMGIVEGVGKGSFRCVHGFGPPGGMRPPLAHGKYGHGTSDVLDCKSGIRHGNARSVAAVPFAALVKRYRKPFGS
jgi:hypothetical protein